MSTRIDTSSIESGLGLKKQDEITVMSASSPASSAASEKSVPGVVTEKALVVTEVSEKRKKHPLHAKGGEY